MLCKNRFIFLILSAIGCFSLFLYWSTYPWFSNKNSNSGKYTFSAHYLPYRSFVFSLTNIFHNFTTAKSKNDSTIRKQNPDLNFDDNLVVIYNRIPKTGSTSFINLAYDLCKKNKFHVLHINITANMHVLSLQNQLDFARNISHWNEMKPALYHGHMAYLDFSK